MSTVALPGISARHSILALGPDGGHVITSKYCLNRVIIYVRLSYDVASESVIKSCIKNDNQLVD